MMAILKIQINCDISKTIWQILTKFCKVMHISPLPQHGRWCSSLLTLLQYSAILEQVSDMTFYDSISIFL